MLQWLRAHDCPWDKRTCSYAAEGGHLAVFQWARQLQCPWDWQTPAAAANERIREWVIAHGCPAEPE
jgi:hypothetical protein